MIIGEVGVNNENNNELEYSDDKDEETNDDMAP